MIDKTQNLIKQIHDCCAWFPASKALSAVPVDIQLQAATKVGLVKQGAIKFCSDRIEYFLAECFKPRKWRALCCLHNDYSISNKVGSK